MRVRLDLGYDGTDFSGWAKQPGRRTVEGVLDDALAMVLRLPAPPGLTVAGRTDAGVHARGQVAHSDLPSKALDDAGGRLLARLRGVLPADLRVTGVRPVPGVFDARFAAVSRRYSYLLSDNPSGVDPLARREVVWHRRPLEVDAMNAAASALEGEHDFAAFCRRREGTTTIRTLLRFGWARRPDGLLAATVVADAFCHNMVRSLVGACVAVGEGRRLPSWVEGLLTTSRRPSEVTVMPPHGLALEEVTYPPDEHLADRVRLARRRRG